MLFMTTCNSMNLVTTSVRQTSFSQDNAPLLNWTSCGYLVERNIIVIFIDFRVVMVIGL